MARPLRRFASAVCCAVVLAGCRASGDRAAVDRDRDGLPDRIEATLAETHLPAIHEFADGALRDECPDPDPRPVLFRARPRAVAGRADLDTVAITYVLLYEQDCGPLPHRGDNEAFTVFLRREPAAHRWQRVAALAVAHQRSPVERVSVGSGADIWVSRNKHANYAAFDACDVTDLPGDVCAEAGRPPARYVFLNVGEPWAPLSRDAGDVLLDARDTSTFLLFRGHGIWDHQPFLEAGEITAQLFLGATRLERPAALEWEAEGPVAPVLGGR